MNFFAFGPVARVVLAGTICSIGFTLAAGQDQNIPKFTELSAKDRAQLDRQRAIIAEVAKDRYDSSLTKTTKDIPVLQHLVDDSVFSKSQTYELQSLGVVFGDVLTSALPLKWVIVTDEYGTEPTLRYKQTTVNVNALTMISKRIERGERVALSRLLQITREQLADAENKFR